MVCAIVLAAGIVLAIILPVLNKATPDMAQAPFPIASTQQSAAKSSMDVPLPSPSKKPAETAVPLPKPVLKAEDGMLFSNPDVYLLTLADIQALEGRSIRSGKLNTTALKAAYNETRAKYGDSFSDKKWKAYFSKKSWYKASGDFDELQMPMTARLNCLLMQAWMQRKDKEADTWIKPVKVCSGDSIDLDYDGKAERIEFSGSQVSVD